MTVSLFRRRSHPGLVARVKAYTTPRAAARMLKDVDDHLRLAITAIDSGDEDTAALEIKTAGALMRSAVEEMPA